MTAFSRYPGTMQDMVDDLAITVHILCCNCSSCSRPERKIAAVNVAMDVVMDKVAARIPSADLDFYVNTGKTPNTVPDAFQVQLFATQLLDRATKWRYN